MDQKLAHLFLCLVVVGVCRFFLGQQPCKFFVQALDRGELFKSEIIKGFLRRLVKYDVALMLRKILFGVSGFAVSGVNLAGLGVVEVLSRLSSRQNCWLRWFAFISFRRATSTSKSIFSLMRSSPAQSALISA